MAWAYAMEFTVRVTPKTTLYLHEIRAPHGSEYRKRAFRIVASPCGVVW
jgi:hypothetical protein